MDDGIPACSSTIKENQSPPVEPYQSPPQHRRESGSSFTIPETDTFGGIGGKEDLTKQNATLENANINKSKFNIKAVRLEDSSESESVEIDDQKSYDYKRSEQMHTDTNKKPLGLDFVIETAEIRNKDRGERSDSKVDELKLDSNSSSELQHDPTEIEDFDNNENLNDSEIQPSNDNNRFLQSAKIDNMQTETNVDPETKETISDSKVESTADQIDRNYNGGEEHSDINKTNVDDNNTRILNENYESDDDKMGVKICSYLSNDGKAEDSNDENENEEDGWTSEVSKRMEINESEHFENKEIDKKDEKEVELGNPDCNISNENLKIEDDFNLDSPSFEPKQIDIVKASQTYKEEKSDHSDPDNAMVDSPQITSTTDQISSTFGVNLETEPAFYEEITENLYLIDKKKSRASKEVRRMTCECVYDPDDPIFVGCDEDCLNRLLKIECSKRCPCGEFCTNQNFQRGCRNNLTVFNAGNKGWGLRTENRIEKGAFVIEYSGEVVDYEEFRSRTHEYDSAGRTHYYFMTLKANEVIDATQKGSPSRFINHSCDPNCVTEKWTVNGYLRVGFFALRTIPAGTELSFDYQLQRYGEKAQICYCGSDNCRGIIGGEKQTPLKQATVDKLGSPWLPLSGSSPKKKGSKKKFVPDDSDGLESELEKILSGRKGISSPDEALDFTRLMVKAKVQYDKIKLLRVLQGSSDQNALKAFIRFKGLALLWSWMIESTDEIVDYKLEILQTLKHIPVQNKNQIEDSRLLQVVTKWSDSNTQPPTVIKPEPDDNIDSNSDTESKEKQEDTPTQDDRDSQTDVDENNDDNVTLSEKTGKDNVVCSTTSDAEKPEVIKDSQLAIMAKDLLDSWKSLKEIFKIPRKSNIPSTTVSLSDQSKDISVSEETASTTTVDDSRHLSPAFPALQSDRISKRSDQDVTSEPDRRFNSPKRSYPRDRDDDSDRSESKIRRDSSYRSDSHRRDPHSRDGTPTKDDYPIGRPCDYYSPRRTHRSRHEYERDRDDERRSSSSRHSRRWHRDGRDHRHESHSREDYEPLHRSSHRDSYNANVQSRLHQDPSVHGITSVNHNPDGTFSNQPPPQERHVLYNLNHQQNISNPNQPVNYNVAVHHQNPNQNQVSWPPPPPPPTAQTYNPTATPQFQPQIGQAPYSIPPAPPNVAPPMRGPFSPPSNPYYNQPQPTQIQQAPQQQYPIQQQQGVPACPLPINQQFPPLSSGAHHPSTIYTEGVVSVPQVAPNAIPYQLQSHAPMQAQQQIAPNIYSGVIQVPLHPQNQFGAGPIQFSTISMQQGSSVVAPSWVTHPSSTTQVSSNQLVQSTADQHMDINSPSTPETGPANPEMAVQSITMTSAAQPSGSDSESMDLDMNESPSATEPIPPLPPGWRTATDPEGKIYYYHVETRVTQWEPPAVKHHSSNVSTSDEIHKKSTKSLRKRQTQISDNVSQKRGPKTPPISPDASPASQREEAMRCRTAAADTTVTRVQSSHRRGPHTPPDPSSHDGHGDINIRMQKVRDAFKAELSHIVVTCLNPYKKSDCKHARITSYDDFKFLARKLTHGLMMKELARVKDDLSLTCTDSVKSKVKDYIKVYMKKFQEIYIRS